MAFESLSDRLQMALRRITGKARLTEQDIEEMMKEIRLSLLEADVNYKVVKEFANEIKEKALGEKILKGLNPSQQVVKIVNDELVKLMGTEAEGININGKRTVIMMVGLQGAGKTTHAGKLANYLRKYNNLKPMLIAADIYRPAAIEQLQVIGKELNVPVFELGTKENPRKIVEKGLKEAESLGCDLVIIDTAGRLHINEELMDELVDIKDIAKPDDILLTVDAMTGQDAVNVAQSFHEKLNVTGCILTKLDGDTRGGAALSIRKVTGVPIKFIGVGEKLDQIEVFHPERMASRILGMGDMLTLIEKATENIDEDEAMKMMEKMMSGKYNYNDMVKQMKTIRRMGKLSGILKLSPGMRQALKNQEIDDKKFNMIEELINSMTEKERRNPELIERSSSRRRRIALGSGHSVTDVNRLIQSFNEQKAMMKRLSSMSEEDMEKNAQMMQNGQFPQPQVKQKQGKGKGKGNFRF